MVDSYHINRLQTATTTCPHELVSHAQSFSSSPFLSTSPFLCLYSYCLCHQSTLDQRKIAGLITRRVRLLSLVLLSYVTKTDCSPASGSKPERAILTFLFCLSLTIWAMQCCELSIVVVPSFWRVCGSMNLDIIETRLQHLKTFS